MSLLEASHLKKSFAQTVAVDDLSFHVEAGEIFGLLGPNGAGKSTAMMMIAGLRRPDAGNISIAGHPVHDGDPAYKAILGVVPQDLAIYPDLTAYENLDFFGRIYGVSKTELPNRIDRVLKQIGLEQHARNYVDTFSGGMKRRLNFGAALVHEPRFVILDEPTVGVDPQSRSHLLDCVRELAASGVGVIYASHYMEEVEAICQRIAIIDHGKLLETGTLDQLLDRTRSDLVLRIAASAEQLNGKVPGDGQITAINGHESELSIRRDRGNTDTTDRLTAVLGFLRSAGLDLISIETREHNLERLFLELTGRKLRD